MEETYPFLSFQNFPNRPATCWSSEVGPVLEALHQPTPALSDGIPGWNQQCRLQNSVLFALIIVKPYHPRFLAWDVNLFYRLYKYTVYVKKKNACSSDYFLYHIVNYIIYSLPILGIKGVLVI